VYKFGKLFGPRVLYVDLDFNDRVLDVADEVRVFAVSFEGTDGDD
jgi:hypothetical protein